MHHFILKAISFANHNHHHYQYDRTKRLILQDKKEDKNKINMAIRWQKFQLKSLSQNKHIY